jgi:hypothetical protein
MALKAVDTIVGELKKQSKPTKDQKNAHVGIISASGRHDRRQHHRRGDGEVREGGHLPREEPKGSSTAPARSPTSRRA